MFKLVLAGELKIGKDHVLTLNTFNNLRSLYHSEDKLRKAKDIYKRALVGRLKTLGPNHISTLDTINNLNALY